MDAGGERGGIEQLAGVGVTLVGAIGRACSAGYQVIERRTQAGVQHPVFESGPLPGQHCQQQQRRERAAENAAWRSGAMHWYEGV